jgi:hypothetical protein
MITTGGSSYTAPGGLSGTAAPLAGNANTTIAPTSFSNLFAGSAMCVVGSIAGASGYNTAAIAINPTVAWVPGTSYTQLCYQVTQFEATPIRLLLQTASYGQSWCKDLTASSGCIALSSFNTTCYTTGGTAYDGSAIGHMAFTVQGGATTALPFDFCLADLYPQ